MLLVLIVVRNTVEAQTNILSKKPEESLIKTHSYIASSMEICGSQAAPVARNVPNIIMDMMLLGLSKGLKLEN